MKADVLAEKECWVQFQQGCAGAYRQIYESHWDSLFNYAYEVLQRYDDCKDLLQDYFTQLWLNREKLPVPENTGGFLMSLLKFRVIDCIRKKHIRGKHIILYAALQPDPYTEDAAGPLLFREEMEKFYQCYHSLPEQLRLVFKMHYFEALSVEEIALRSAKSKQTVRNQLNIATTRLRTQLKNSFPVFLF